MSDTSKDDELRSLLIENQFGIKPGDRTDAGLLINNPHIKLLIDRHFAKDKTKMLIKAIKQYGIQQRIEELDKLPRTGWISNGIRYDAILFTQIDNRKLELIELKDKQEEKEKRVRELWEEWHEESPEVIPVRRRRGGVSNDSAPVGI